MESFLLTIQILVACLIIGAILIQAQGASLGGTWGGGGETFHTRRGVERVIFFGTMILIGIFALVSLYVAVG